MTAPEARRTLIHLRDEEGESLLRVDILMDGRVRLHTPVREPDFCAETLEDLTLFAAASELDGGLYAALLWELDLLAQRGDSGWSAR